MGQKTYVAGLVDFSWDLLSKLDCAHPVSYKQIFKTIV